MNAPRVDNIFTADPRANYLAYKGEIDAAIAAMLAQPDYAGGAAVSGFEAAFAHVAGCNHGVGVNSGTDAIHLALRALEIGAGDEVITVSHTSVATVAAIEMAGATPVFADIEPAYFTIDAKSASRAIGPRTRAIVAVHLYGQPADIPSLQKICSARGLALVEDCAQCHGAAWGGRPAGSFGTVSCFSFYPTKNLGAIGDGGMICTNDNALAARAEMLRQYGWRTRQFSEAPGFNSRLDPLQAAILAAKLPHLAETLARRLAIAAAYNAALADLPLRLPQERPDSTHAWHLYVVRCRSVSERQELLAHLAQRGIVAGVHYPVPVHLQPAYKGRLMADPLPETESAANEILSLPIYPELAETQQARVIAAIGSYFGKRP